MDKFGDYIPDELLWIIFSYMDYLTLLQLSQTNKKYYKVLITKNRLFKHFYKKYFFNEYHEIIRKRRRGKEEKEKVNYRELYVRKIIGKENKEKIKKESGKNEKKKNMIKVKKMIFVDEKIPHKCINGICKMKIKGVGISIDCYFYVLYRCINCYPEEKIKMRTDNNNIKIRREMYKKEIGYVCKYKFNDCVNPISISNIKLNDEYHNCRIKGKVIFDVSKSGDVLIIISNYMYYLYFSNTSSGEYINYYKKPYIMYRYPLKENYFKSIGIIVNTKIFKIVYHCYCNEEIYFCDKKNIYNCYMETEFDIDKIKELKGFNIRGFLIENDVIYLSLFEYGGDVLKVCYNKKETCGSVLKRFCINNSIIGPRNKCVFNMECIELKGELNFLISLENFRGDYLYDVKNGKLTYLSEYGSEISRKYYLGVIRIGNEKFIIRKKRNFPPYYFYLSHSNHENCCTFQISEHFVLNNIRRSKFHIGHDYVYVLKRNKLICIYERIGEENSFVSIVNFDEANLLHYPEQKE